MKHVFELDGLHTVGSARSEYYITDHAPSRKEHFSWWECTIASFWIYFFILGSICIIIHPTFKNSRGESELKPKFKIVVQFF